MVKKLVILKHEERVAESDTHIDIKTAYNTVAVIPKDNINHYMLQNATAFAVDSNKCIYAITDQVVNHRGGCGAGCCTKLTKQMVNGWKIGSYYFNKKGKMVVAPKFSNNRWRRLTAQKAVQLPEYNSHHIILKIAQTAEFHQLRLAIDEDPSKRKR